MEYSRRYIQSLKERRNFLLSALPKALAMAKRNKNNPLLRSMALKLYYSQRRDLAEVKETLKPYTKVSD